MNIYAPHTVSYEALLGYVEDRLWQEQALDDFIYLVDLVDELYLKTLETEIGTLNGCLRTEREDELVGQA